MKITLYTITDCEFCKEEKEYFKSHNLQFEEKNLEQNKEWLTEMLAVSNNFAGTPVTKIEKDDGTTAVLKGFTKEEFDQTLGFSQAGSATPTPPKAEEPKTPPVETPTPPPAETPPPPPVETPPSAEIPTQEPPAETSTPPPAEPPAAPSQTQEANDALNSILQDLQAKSAAPSPGPATPAMTGAVPHPDSEPPPAVPDFQAKT